MGHLKDHMQTHHGDQLRSLPNDEATPPCRICGAPHIGNLASCHLVLRGNYVFSPAFGREVFILDPDIELTAHELPNGAIGFVVNVDPAEESAMVMHEDCTSLALNTVEHADCCGESWFDE